MIETEATTQLVPNQLGSFPRPSRNDTVHPWGMSYNFTPYIVNDGSFFLNQPGHQPQFNGNIVIHP